MAYATDVIKPRIYVACLAAYTGGVLHGAWLEACQDAWAIYDGISAMLRASPITDADEWAIHDYEGFEGVRLAEGEGIDRVAEIAAFIVAHGKLGAELIAYHGDVAGAQSAMEDGYAGKYPSVVDFVQELTEETTAIPETLRYYIDWQAMARDLTMSDLIALETDHYEVHVFWSR